MNSNGAAARPLDLVIPFYRGAALAKSLLASLGAVQDELAATRSSILAIDDSGGDARLAEAIRGAAKDFRIPFEIAVNERNLGFVASANIGLRRAVERGHDVLLLNSDTVVFPGAVAEMRRVAALDPMIGFVNPRSDRATVFSLPQREEHRADGPAASHALFARLAPHLPEIQFIPTAVGFCMLVKYEVLEEFGPFDECYSPGYNEENDLVMRANRCGYSAVLANRAFVWHEGGGSFAAPERAELECRNRQTLHRRYPEYAPSVERYLSGPNYAADGLLSALLPDSRGRLAVAFDFSTFGLHHNGTFEAGKRILERAARDWPFSVWAIVSPEVGRFHKLNRVPGLSCVEPGAGRVFAAVFRFGQPFAFDQVARMARAGLVNVYGMLDPIALDCLHLRQPDLEALWGTVFAHADGVVYISDFSAGQFRLRFPRREGLRELVCPLSLDVRDYEQETSPGRGEHLLVIGNHFAHKRLAPTVRALREAFPDLPIAALGLDRDAVPGVRGFPSGHLKPGEVLELYRNARLVVFPSLYEGFGLPVMEGLAHRKPVLVRDTPAAREIRHKGGLGENLILYSSTGDLVRRLRAGFPVWRGNGASPGGAGWDCVAKTLGRFIGELVESFSLEKVTLPRLRHVHALETVHPPPVAAAGDDPRLRDREARIADLENSWSWRLTAPLRTAGGLYLRLKGRG